MRQEIPARNFSIELKGSTLIAAGQGVIYDTDISVNEVPWNGWYDPIWAATLCKDQLYAIQLKGAHPYHQHINSFQVVRTKGPSNTIRVGEYRDVVIGASGSSATESTDELIYMKTFDYSGIYILHCHITEHEDAGLMGGFEVLDTCSSDVGIWNISETNGQIQIGLGTNVQTALDFLATLTDVFEYPAGDFTAVPATQYSAVNGFGMKVNPVKNPPYPTLCGSNHRNCFDITVMGQIQNGGGNRTGDMQLTLRGGFNPSTTTAVSIAVDPIEQYSLGPLGLKFDTNLQWTAKQTASGSGFALGFSTQWIYSGSTTSDFGLTPILNPFQRVIGFTLHYGSHTVQLVFPGSISANFPDGTSRLLPGNIIPDQSRLVLSSTGGSARVFVVFEFVPNATIKVDPAMEVDAQSVIINSARPLGISRIGSFLLFCFIAALFW